jgi:hypothetical protein
MRIIVQGLYRCLSGPNDRQTIGGSKYDNTPFTVVFNNVAREEGCSMRALHGDPSVLQLLLHYNGVYDINHILLAPDGTPLQGLEGVIDRISQYAEDTRAQPGEGEKQIRYSNANYILLALLIDKASKSFNGFLKEYIFKRNPEAAARSI